MYYLFVENEKINGAGQCPIINEEIENVEVLEDVYNKYIETPNYYIYQDGEIVVNPNYEIERNIAKKQERINDLKFELEYIDLKTVRPMRAILSNTDCENDKKYINELEENAQKIRIELNSLM